MSEPLVEAHNLVKYFSTRTGSLFRRRVLLTRAVDGITLRVRSAENTAVVGESGCGKTTLGRLLLRLIWPTKGSVYFAGRSIFEIDEDELRNLRPKMQMIFQNPFSSLNPRKTVRDILGIPFKLHVAGATRDGIHASVCDLLEEVGLTPPELYLDRFPHEFSGGQRQRIVIARAMALKPSFVVADEPVSSLDLSVRAQILNLMKKLQSELKMTYLFITHDLAVVRSLCNAVAVMYLGKIVERANADELFRNPLHPYTQALLHATPIPDPEKSRLREIVKLRGEVPSPTNPPPGCRFHPRCPRALQRCSSQGTQLMDAGGGHLVSCHQVH